MSQGVATFADDTSESSTVQNGKRDISASAVDSITTMNSDGTESQNKVTVGSSFTVVLNFSEDSSDGTQKTDFDIQSGDQILITWKAPEGTYLTAYSNTIDLTQDGLVIAQAVVTESGVTVTFNDNVNNLQHVNGNVKFLLKTGTESGKTYSETSDAIITSGEISTSIVVNPYVAPNVFGAKSGWYQDDATILWQISFNRQYTTDISGNLVITDQLPETEEFYIFDRYEYRGHDENGKNIYDKLAYSLDDFNARSGCSFSIDENNLLTITIPAKDIEEFAAAGKMGYIQFYTKAKSTRNNTVYNTAKILYSDGNGNSATKEYTASVAIPNSSGEISGVPQGTIKIYKTVKNSTDPIEGVTFRIYKVVSESDHSREQGWYNDADYAELVTDTDGVATITGLNDGYYEIEEVSDNLPNWISSTSLPDSIFVKLEGTAGERVDIENEIKTTDITATKYWLNSDGQTADTSTHPEIFFKLYRSVDGDEMQAVEDAELMSVVTAEGASKASVTWNNMPQYDNSGNVYTYSVKEVDATGNDSVPTGYSKTEDGLNINNIKISKSDENGDEDDSTDENTDSENSKDESDDESSTNSSSSPKTSDEENLISWITILTVSILSLIHMIRKQM